MFEIRRFTLADMTNCGTAIRALAEDVETMEEAAGRIVRYLHEEFRSTDTDEFNFPLVRLFKTHPYQELPPDLRSYAAGHLGHEPWMPQT